MTKPKATSKKPRTANQQPAPRAEPAAQQSLWHRIPLLAKAIGGALSFAVLLLTIYLAFAPQLEIQIPTAGADPSDPFNQPFLLVNDGSFSVYGVTANCGPPLGIGARSLSGTGIDPNKPAQMEGDSGLFEFSTRELEPHVPTPFTCASFSSVRVSGQIVAVDYAWLTITVHCDVLGFIPWWSPKTVSFIANAGSDGKLYWSVEPLSKLPAAAPSTH
jgi:hypothetical protein